MNIIFSIEGGLGKSIMSTAVLKAMKKQYPKSFIIIITAYPDVFVGNPNVNKVLTHDSAKNLYENFISKKDCKVFISDPYLTSDYITEEKHLIPIWCDMFGIHYDGELPELYISNSERQYFEPFYRLDKPIMVIHPHGGAVNQPLKYSWTRDIPQPIMEDIIDYYHKDYSILHVKREDQIIYNNTFQALDSFRSIAVLLTLSTKRLLIDSSVMHIATALKLPSVVTWVGTNPIVFGYNRHTNIMSNNPTKEINTNNNFLSKHLLFEDISTIPYNDLREVFDTQKIIDSINQQ